MVDVVRHLCELPQGEPGAVTQSAMNAALASAAQNGHSNVVRYLCELPQGHPEAVNPWGLNNAALSAAQNGHSTVLRYLCELPLDRGVTPSRSNNYAIYWAAHNGHMDVVRYLCELPPDRGVDPSATVLWAARNGDMDVLRYLCELPLNRGVDPSAEITSPFDGQQKPAMCMWCGTCVSCHGIEAWIRCAPSAFRTQCGHHTQTGLVHSWIWCGTCVNCRYLRPCTSKSSQPPASTHLHSARQGAYTRQPTGPH